MKITIEFASVPTSITKVEPLLQRLSKRVPINEETYAKMQIALTEAVNNAILHGNQSDPSKKVIVAASYQSGAIEFEVTDEGKGFDAAKVPDPTLPENIAQPGGRGVFLMQELCDKFLYTAKGRTALLTFHQVGQVEIVK
jgi:serine/threonine-protein kinase RsbW